MSDATSLKCPRCGAPCSTSAPADLCPRCLMGQALADVSYGFVSEAPGRGLSTLAATIELVTVPCCHRVQLDH